MSNCRTCKYLFNNTAIDDHCYHCREDNNYEEDEWLAKHNKEIYNQALEDFRKKINDFLSGSDDFADFVVTDSAINYVIDELKKREK